MQGTCPPPPADRGDIVLGWLGKLVAVLGVTAVVAFDGLSVAGASLSLEDQAVVAARDASDAFLRMPTAQAAYDAGFASAVGADPTNELRPDDLRISPDRAVTVTLRRTAPTLVLQRIGPLRHWADRSATATATPLP